MDQFSPVPLTNAGRPLFLNEDEVEIKSFDKVEVYEGSASSSKRLFSDMHILHLMLSNVRLIVILQNQQNNLISWGFFLKNLRDFEDPNNESFFKRSKRVRLFFHSKPDTTQGYQAVNEVEIRFLDGNKEEFMEFLRRTLDRKSWDYILNKVQVETNANRNQMTPNPPKNQSDGTEFSVKNAGIGGIMRRQEQTVQNMDQLTKIALSDLNHLIEKAREVVSTVQRYAQTIQESSASASEKDETMSETSTQINERYEIENIMQDIGIISPVTKLSSGRSYHKQLAREICDILLTKDRLLRLGGIITLTDLYCLINKLHGTDLVSPHDLVKASECVESLRLGIKMKVFPKSEVKVLQLTSSTPAKGDSSQDAEFTNQILRLIGSSPYYRENGATSSEINQSLNLSYLVVKELLYVLEQQQKLCRDDSVEGVRFFINEFPNFISRTLNV